MPECCFYLVLWTLVTWYQIIYFTPELHVVSQLQKKGDVALLNFAPSRVMRS